MIYDEIKRRITTVRQLLKWFEENAGGDPEDIDSNLVDIVANIMHFCERRSKYDKNAYSFDKVLRIAAEHYTYEAHGVGEIGEGDCITITIKKGMVWNVKFPPGCRLSYEVRDLDNQDLEEDEL